MRSLGLRGAIVWDLRVAKEFPHSHAFIHEAIHANLLAALRQANSTA